MNVAGLVAAVIVIALFAARALGVNVDPLLMKNRTFFFAHVLVNITMYLGVAMVYALLPMYAGRPWKTNRVVAITWDAVLFLILFLAPLREDKWHSVRLLPSPVHGFCPTGLDTEVRAGRFLLMLLPATCGSAGSGVGISPQFEGSRFRIVRDPPSLRLLRTSKSRRSTKA